MQVVAGVVAFIVGGMWLWRAVSPETAWWLEARQGDEHETARSRIQAGVVAALFLAAGVVWMVAAGR